MMTAMEAPIPAEQLMIVPANEASWDDLAAIFGTTDPGQCQCQRFKVVGWIWRDSTQEERTAMPSGGWSCGSTSNNEATYVDGRDRRDHGGAVSRRGAREPGGPAPWSRGHLACASRPLDRHSPSARQVSVLGPSIDAHPEPIAEERTMTSLSDRPDTALLVIDVQNDVVANAHNRDGVIANIAVLVGKARAEGAPVIWVQHSDDNLPQDSDGWQYVPELTREGSEPLIHKQYGDSFEATDLEAVLAERKVGRLIVAGAQTDECIRSTLHGAIVRGYDATLVSDAHTTEDQTQWGAPTPDKVIAHTNLYWQYHTAPGRRGGTVPTDSVDFRGTPV